ncbi:MAG: hypothetical protein COA96_15040 [SAR86 cluster bacterium]|uniref:Helix-turn-helix domain-containing protein n=1 Tax=SAR86 cluster bacterium TaxID=2030880 RepID=A0A2A5ARQ4_9GAMM|nr:MAG: hypothetical protein COA96_15040 [SAR86 cluster bacterium]
MSRDTGNDYFPHYFMIPAQLLQNERLNKTDCYVYATIYWYAHLGFKKCIASNPEIARIIGASESTVVTSLTKLEKEKCIKREFYDRGRRHRKEIKALIELELPDKILRVTKSDKSDADITRPQHLQTPEEIEKIIMDASTDEVADEMHGYFSTWYARFEDQGYDVNEGKKRLDESLEKRYLSKFEGRIAETQ